MCTNAPLPRHDPHEDELRSIISGGELWVSAADAVSYWRQAVANLEAEPDTDWTAGQLALARQHLGNILEILARTELPTKPGDGHQ